MGHEATAEKEAHLWKQRRARGGRAESSRLTDGESTPADRRLEAVRGHSGGLEPRDAQAWSAKLSPAGPPRLEGREPAGGGDGEEAREGRASEGERALCRAALQSSVQAQRRRTAAARSEREREPAASSLRSPPRRRRSPTRPHAARSRRGCFARSRRSARCHHRHLDRPAQPALRPGRVVEGSRGGRHHPQL